jgi:hypothetical protein
VVGASNFIIFTPNMTAVRSRCQLRFGQPSPGVGPQPLASRDEASQLLAEYLEASGGRIVASGSRHFSELQHAVAAAVPDRLSGRRHRHPRCVPVRRAQLRLQNHRFELACTTPELTRQLNETGDL